MKKRRRELAFSCVSSDACRLRGTPAGDFYIAVSGQKFLRIVKGLFSKSPLTGVWGGAPYISRGARGRASHMLNRGKESPAGLPAARHPFEESSLHFCQLIIKIYINHKRLDRKTGNRQFSTKFEKTVDIDCSV